MQKGTAILALFMMTLAGSLGAGEALAADRVNSASWLTFYESLADMKRSMTQEQVESLNQDLSTIDAYYLGRYLDGNDGQLGDLELKSDLSGLDSKGIHALAVKYGSAMDKLSQPNNHSSK